MRHFIIFLYVAGTLSCSRSRLSDEPFPPYETPDEDWITYEGTIPWDHGVEAYVELSLRPGAPGIESFYSMHETITGKYAGLKFATGMSSKGKYAVLIGGDARILQIQDRQKMKTLPHENYFGKVTYEQEDLYLKISNDHELVLVDKDFQRLEKKYTLIRRTSPLFTVEGYFTVYDDTTDFFERNTRKKWSIAQLGEYDLAVKKYNYVSKEKFEGVYIKALSYTVRSVDKGGKEIDALVFKTLLGEDSLRSFNEQ